MVTYFMGLQTLTNVKETHIDAMLKQNVRTMMGITHVSVQSGILEMEKRKEGAKIQ